MSKINRKDLEKIEMNDFPNDIIEVTFSVRIKNKRVREFRILIENILNAIGIYTFEYNEANISRYKRQG